MFVKEEMSLTVDLSLINRFIETCLQIQKALYSANLKIAFSNFRYKSSRII